MKIYITLDKNGYVDGWGSTSSHVDDEVEIELDDTHKFFKTDSACWKYENGELVFDEERQQKLIEEYEREQGRPSELDMLALAILELAAELEKLKGDK